MAESRSVAVTRGFLLSTLLPALATAAHPCAACHPKEVDGYSRTAMGRSLRTPANEPEGSFELAPASTTFEIRNTPGGFVQRMTHAGQTSAYRIDYVIGSGAHASCFLARVGDHLFESPLCYYPGARGYAMAPGYEDNPDPGFTRPITLECLECHSGKPLPIAGSLNRYRAPAFAAEAISCDRCHGNPAAHLKRPIPGSIVNPAKLAPSLRDSICEQCHLSGAIRVLNPGKTVAEFHPGEPLENTFTTYVAAAAADAPQQVVSQSEQLARSRCALASNGRMWCATCHDPHSTPTEPAAYFRSRCLSCHRAPLPAAHPARTRDCLPCHMPRREALDGGHTAFTDHRIERRPHPQDAAAGPIEDLRPWRPAPASLRARNLALALSYAGQKYSSDTLAARSIPLLQQALSAFPNDADLLSALGATLLRRKDAAAAIVLFERALAIRPHDASLLDSAGAAKLEAGDRPAAAQFFERALETDPLLLPDIEALLGIYRETGDRERETALLTRVREAMRTPPAAAAPQQR